MIQISSERNPIPTPVARLAYEAARRADAMGILRAADVAGLDLDAVRYIVERVGAAGIARFPAHAIDNVEPVSREEAAALLRLVIDALEASPLPASEWPSLARVFEPEQLAALLGISVSSLRRYLAGGRETPDAVAARLHFLALVVGDLSGAYNQIGIRRWFNRRRERLDGRTPADLLSGEWDPDEAGPQKVRALGRSLVTLSVT
jgi:transcriptional regulator with XRE-family HTH domain